MRVSRFVGPGLCLLFAAAVLFAACGGDDNTSGKNTSIRPGSATTAAAASPTAATGSASSGSAGTGAVEGTITTSGEVTGTWTWKAGNAVSSSAGEMSVTVSSPDGRFGYVTVQGDGSVRFGTGSSKRGPWGGAGGKLELKGSGGTKTACGLTVDTTVKSNSGGATSVAVKGALTIKGTVEDPDAHRNITC